MTRTPGGRQPRRKEPGWDEDPGLLTRVFFLLYHRCNVEKVPSNSQLEIEGNRSGSVLYSCVSKYRYPLAHHPAFEADPSNGLLIIPPCSGRWRHRCSRPPVAAFVPTGFSFGHVHPVNALLTEASGAATSGTLPPDMGSLSLPLLFQCGFCLPSRGPLNSALSWFEA